jgi:hypothetical protein
MSSERLDVIIRWLAILLVAAYVVVGIVGLFADIEPTRDLVIFVVLLWGGAFLILAGLATFASSPWLSAVLITVGAAAGALAAVLSVVRARRSRQTAAEPAADEPGAG